MLLGKADSVSVVPLILAAPPWATWPLTPITFSSYTELVSSSNGPLSLVS